MQESREVLQKDIPFDSLAYSCVYYLYFFGYRIMVKVFFFILFKNQINFYDFEITVYRNVKLLLIFIKNNMPENGAPVYNNIISYREWKKNLFIM